MESGVQKPFNHREISLIRQITTLLAKHVLTSHTVWVNGDAVLWKIPYYSWIATLPYLDSAKFCVSTGYGFRLKLVIREGHLSLYVQLMNTSLTNMLPFSGVVTIGVMDQEESNHCVSSFAALPSNKSFCTPVTYEGNPPSGVADLVNCQTIQEKYVNSEDTLVIAACIRYRQNKPTNK